MVVYSTRIDTHNVHNLKHSHTYTNQSRERLVEHFPFFFSFFFLALHTMLSKASFLKPHPKFWLERGKKGFALHRTAITNNNALGVTLQWMSTT